MAEAFICDYIRTPIGRFGGALAPVRADDLGAVPLKALMARNASVDWEAVDDVIYGCANQAGEDNRNVGRMSWLLAGLPQAVPSRHHQPAVRLRHGCHADRRPRHQGRRGRYLRGRWR
jgi:acetyl-CoA acetyltransferase